MLAAAAFLTAAQSQHAQAGVGLEPPKSATVLFNGKSLDKWSKAGTSDAAGWKVGGGAAEVVPGSGSIWTKKQFGSGHYHVEFNVPLMPNEHSQGRGNSGFYLMAVYEIQILDSVDNPTYATGGCGSLYSLKDPDSNQAKKPGEWQAYDAYLTAPVLDADGNVSKPGHVTVWWNGVLVHKDVELTYKDDQHKAVSTGPVLLQDHGCPVKFRNVWYAPLSHR